MLCLLVTAGVRVDHLRLLDVDDFDPTHAFEDGSCGPGLRCRRTVMKNGGHRDDVYWKRLPPFVGEVLTAWIVCSGRTIGQAAAPLLIATRIAEPGDPGGRYADGSSLSKFVSGTQRPAAGRSSRSRAGSGAATRPIASASRSRRWSSDVSRPGSSTTLRTRSRPMTPKAVAELALDHTLNDLGYRDYTDRRRLEEVLALAIDLCWDECWGEGLQRLGLDPDAIVMRGMPSCSCKPS